MHKESMSSGPGRRMFSTDRRALGPCVLRRVGYPISGWSARRIALAAWRDDRRHAPYSSIMFCP